MKSVEQNNTFKVVGNTYESILLCVVTLTTKTSKIMLCINQYFTFYYANAFSDIIFSGINLSNEINLSEFIEIGLVYQTLP